MREPQGAQWAGGAGASVIGGWRAGPKAGAGQRGGLRVRDSEDKATLCAGVSA